MAIVAVLLSLVLASVHSLETLVQAGKVNSAEDKEKTVASDIPKVFGKGFPPNGSLPIFKDDISKQNISNNSESGLVGSNNVTDRYDNSLTIQERCLLIPIMLLGGTKSGRNTMRLSSSIVKEGVDLSTAIIKQLRPIENVKKIIQLTGQSCNNMVKNIKCMGIVSNLQNGMNLKLTNNVVVNNLKRINIFRKKPKHDPHHNHKHHLESEIPV
uniref:Uncharacterized protein n=1 Tax=Clastoptera arizonana TaxID=38151 RepID=A0A1B6C787_9HEMI